MTQTKHLERTNSLPPGRASSPARLRAAEASRHPPLRIDDVPDIQAPFYPDIAEFALTFHGYRHRTPHELAASANFVREAWMRGKGGELLFEPPERVGCLDSHLPLNELRAVLFFEQRRHHWNESEPLGADLRYLRALVAAIAQRVKPRKEHNSD